jgi:hypothetical protein
MTFWNWLLVGMGSSTDWRQTVALHHSSGDQPAVDRATTVKLTPKNSTTRVIPYRSTLLCEVTLPAALRKKKPAKTQVPARIAICSGPAATTAARTRTTQAANPSTPAAVERHSLHPIGRALVEAAQSRSLAALPVHEVVETVGHGIQAEVKGRQVMVHGAEPLDGEMRVVCEVDGHVAATFVLEDRIKADAARVFERIQGLGIEVAMATGESASHGRTCGA